VRAGLAHAKGQAIVIIDADLQDPPEIIPGMLQKWREGYEVVYGKRKSREGETFFKTFTAFAFYRVLNFLSSVEIPKDTGDFRLIDERVKDAILSMKEHSTFLRGMVSWVGFKQYAYEFERRPREAGESKYPLKKMLKLAFDGIFSFSTTPIKFLGLAGFGLAALGFVLFIVGLLVKMSALWLGIFAMSFFAGLLFLGMYILGEYIGRIYEEAMDRPLYIISRIYGSDNE